MSIFVELNDVTICFENQQVFDRLNLVLEENIAYALIGKSGSGKSTLLNLIAGFLNPDKGRITIKGSILNQPRRETSFLFQELGLFPWQTVGEAIAMPLKIKGWKKDDNWVVEDMIKEIGLDGHQHKYPKELSGGERQRVALARTLIEKPDLLLMDEPTSALDAMTKEVLQKLILKEQMKQKGTLLFVTHDVEEAMILGQTILIINDDGHISSITNPYFGITKPREQLGFYDACIKIRKRLNMEVLGER
ncbi:MAG: ABC transporter ATP-binding protein [Firmicutes bacterium HGW-Firmicutes-2]|jgi:NitT/TauT family transport system ATP-binding protein|nr:MAG: ABC transporter ATP-binding protein [Firmicutes bacterium HGW-Firmicutes-2]